MPTFDSQIRQTNFERLLFDSRKNIDSLWSIRQMNSLEKVPLDLTVKNQIQTRRSSV